MDDVIWLTYDELADRLGIERESARQHVKRKRWARRPGNDGKVRIGVPEEVLTAKPEPGTEAGSDPVHNPVQPPEQPQAQNQAHDPGVTEVLARHIERLEGQLERALERAEDRDEIARERDAVTAQVEALRGTIAAMEASLSVERDRRADVEADRDAWRAAAQRPLWRRLFG